VTAGMSNIDYLHPDKDFTYCPPISKQEFLFPLVWAILICILGSFPYLYGHYIAGENRVFMGMVGRGTSGSLGYIMFQQQAWEGKNLLVNQCTPENLDTSFFHVEWWLLGRLARWLHLSVIAFFHVDRIISVFLFSFAVYYLIAINLDIISHRRFVFVLITVCSGFGWIILLLNKFFNLSLPLGKDLEGIQILSYLICKPHFVRSLTCAVLMYAFLIRGFQTGKTKYFILSGLMALIHSLMRPFLIPESYIMFALTPILFCWFQNKWEKKWFYLSLIPAVIHFPAILYYLWMSISDPLGMSGWSQNNQFLGKPGFLIEYIIGVGWTWLACLVFFFYLTKKCKERISFLILFSWILVAWGICNLYPYWKPGQESGLYAFFIVPPILTMVGPYTWFTEKIKELKIKNKLEYPIFKWKHFLIVISILIILFSIPSSAFVYVSMFNDLKDGHPIWTYYLTKDSFNGLQYMNNKVDENAVVLASPRTSPFIFAYTHCKTVTGHFMLTRDYVQKNGDVIRFFSDTLNKEFQREILMRYNVDLIFFGPYEKGLSRGNKPIIFDELTKIFGEGDTEIYQVKINKHEK